MSYLNQTQQPRSRTAAIAGVIIVHTALGYALVTGLSYKFIEHIEIFDPPTIFTDPPKSPPPDPVKQETPKDSELVSPLPPIDLTPIAPVEIKPFDPVVISDPVVTPLPAAQSSLLPPKAQPGLAPARAVPRNDQRNWVITDDYPARPLRERAEGVTGFRVIVGTDGKVDACEVTKSSGNAELDTAACRNVTRRARFEAATDSTGAKVVGTYSSTVRWRIPPG